MPSLTVTLLRPLAALATLAALLLASPGYARAEDPPAKPSRMGLLPSRALNVAAPERARLDALLRARLTGRPVEIVTSAKLAAALGTRGAACAEDPTCLRDVGQRIGAARLLAPRFGRLAETLILRLTVYETTRGTRQGSWQKVLTRTDDKTLAAAFDGMLDSIAPRPREAPRFYQRWWFWTAIGAAVVGGTVTAIVLATRGESPDDNVVPPTP